MSRPGPATIDCDLHAEVPGIRTLFPYLPAYLVEQIENTVFRGPTDSYYLRPAAHTRPGTPPPAAGGDGRSSLDRMRKEVLDDPGLSYGILNCTYAVDGLHNPDHAAALARATNDWLIAEWLDRDPRLRASMVVPSQIPDLAAEEIDRVGDHPGFVQVFLPVRSQHPYGSRLFRTMWRAIAEHDLVAGIHYGGAPGSGPTPMGWTSYYLEEYVAMAQVFACQVASLVYEGVFDLFPEMRVTLLEGGFTWLPAHTWRLDKEWKNLRRLVPWVRRPPSDYLAEHVRLSVQPLDAPPDPRHLIEVIEQLGSDDMLLYASDYPHRHVFDPQRDLLAHLPDSVARKIRVDNAAAWYRLPPSEATSSTPAAMRQGGA